VKTKIKMPGFKKLIFFGNEIALESNSTSTNEFLTYKNKASYEVIFQRSSAFQKSIKIEANELLELEFEDGLIRILTLDQLAEEFLVLKADEIVLPIQIGSRGQSRGLLKNAIKFLRVLVLGGELDEIGVSALSIAKKIENKLPNGEGLFFCQDPNNLGKPVKKLTSKSPILLLLHGTASNTQGSFGGFISDGVISNAWGKLQKNYKNQIVAYEHKTLSKSPLQNALELLEVLPNNAEIHLITHSRGGLIGEILSRNLTDRSQAFSELDIKVFEDLGNRESDIDSIQKINQLFESKNIKVTKFVRVACPTSGTTLASKRLDHYFTIILNLLGLIPLLKVSPVYNFVKSFLIAFVKQKENISVLPGLEAMMPSAPLIKILNNAGQKIKSDLYVISGDVKASGIKHSIAVMLTDVFYRTKHDFVVNTASMFGGSRRDNMNYTFYSNKNVSHFSYFINQHSQDDIATALTDISTSENRFKKIIDGLVDTSEDSSVRGVLDYVDPSKERLKIGVSEVEAFQLMGSAYKDLLKALKDKNNVVPFPYDWRISIIDSAFKLAADLEKRMELSKQPIKLIAHSMGGLVVHAMFAHPELRKTWNKLMLRPGGRVIFLGTPFKGSHMIPSVFMKENKAFKTLHRIDLTNNSSKILEIISEFTGLLQLLPVEAKHDFFDSAKLLEDNPIDKEGVIYIAGKDRYTPADLQFKNSKARIMATSLGDGSVTWKTGIPKTLEDNTWYMEATHGELCASKKHFPAIIDLLETGTTTLLDKLPIRFRGELDLFEMPEDTSLSINTERALEFAIMGIDPNLKLEEPELVINVEICHGDLGNAKYPVAVGHHLNDPIVSAERAVDHYMENQLSKNKDLGLYPGVLESSFK